MSITKKIQRQIDNGVDHPKCDTILFGQVMGRKSVFLVQNMFPVTKEYIENIYIDKNTKNEVTIPPKTESNVIHCARKILKLSHRNINLIFGHPHDIYKALSAELMQQETEKQNTIVKNTYRKEQLKETCRNSCQDDTESTITKLKTRFDP